MKTIASKIQSALRKSRSDAWANVDAGVLYVGYGERAGEAVAFDLAEARAYLASI